MEQVLAAVHSLNAPGGNEHNRQTALKYLERFQNTVRLSPIIYPLISGLD